MSIRSKGLLTLCMALLALGCHRVNAGRVKAKNHHAAYVWMQMLPCGKSFIFVPHYEPERWSVTVADSEGSEEWYYDHDAYEKIHIGDTLRREP